MGYRLWYTTPWGRQWEMLTENWVTGLNAAGIDGLVAQSTDVTTESPFVAGQILDSQNIGPMTGSLRVAVGPDGPKPAGDVWAEFRAGFSRTLVGTLSLHSPRYGRVSTQVRLAATLPPPDVEPNDEGVIDELPIQLISDQGVWLHDTVSGTGEVTVTNFGGVDVSPQIRWSGAGGTVTVPSGATFSLPAVEEERILLLSPVESLAVITPLGEIDYPLMRQLQAALPEVVPEGQSRTYVMPPGAALEWQIGVMDPWL